MEDGRAILAVDVGGRHVKLLTSTAAERRRFPSGRDLTPAGMVERVVGEAAGWEWDVVSLGIPMPVDAGAATVEPVHLAPGWVGFDFAAAFGKPTRVVNDAVMQAIGSYEGGSMLFLGLGTGLGTVLIVEGVVQPLELAHLPFRTGTFEDYVSRAVLERHGTKRWTRDVHEVVGRLTAAIRTDDVVVGGGAADQLTEPPPGVRIGGNELAFVGGFRLWDEEWAERAARG